VVDVGDAKMTREDRITGRYTFHGGGFVADAGMLAINHRLSRMKLLTDTGAGVPSFYMDPGDGSYWECDEFEDYRKQLLRVDRSYIEENFPTVDPDKSLG
jgi:hypothetical protein